MTNDKRLLLCAMALILFFAASCKRHGEKDFKPSKLVGELFSGESLQTVERKLVLMAGNFDILVDRRPLPSDTRPPYRLLVISKKNARVEGQTGELVLTFFNDRLMTAQFYPADLDAARAAVEAGQRISLAGGDSHIAPSTRVWLGKDENGRSYIGWIDKTLQAEQDAWVKQYGQ
jgi:alkanesulfonate monooxygenase SsuD/methylene tetrahydromethanopterin reductase-like flavin-dependent oxidoreductase (luciferase family)